GVPDTTDNCPAVSNTDQADGDGDKLGDACDCAPADGQLAAIKLVDDDLASDKGAFAVGTNFPADWSYAGGAYVQSVLGPQADATLATVGGPLEDVYVEVHATSTQVVDPYARRQILILTGATVNGGQFAAKACGFEVITGQTPPQKLSIVSLAGPAGGTIATTNVKIADRPLVQVGDEVTVKMTVKAGTMTCQLIFADGGSYQAMETGLQGLSGTVG